MAKHYSKHQVGRKILSLCLALAMFCSSVSAGTPRIFADADPAQVVSAEKDAKPVTEANDAAEQGGATGTEEAVEGDSQGGSVDEADAPVYTVTLKPEGSEEPAAEDEADDTLKSIDEADKTEEGEDGDADLTDGQKTEDETVSEPAVADNDDPADAEAGKDGEDKQPEAGDLVPDENKGSEEDGKESDAVSGPALTESGDQTNEDGQDGTDVVDNNEDPANANAAETEKEELTTPAANADGDVDVQTSEPAVETTPEVIEEETSSEAIEAVTTSDAVEVVTTTDAVEEQTSEPAVEGETSEPAIEEVVSEPAIEEQTSESAIETTEPAVEELTSSDAIETSGEAITSGEAVEGSKGQKHQRGPWEASRSFKQTFKTNDYHGPFRLMGMIWDFFFNHGKKTVMTNWEMMTNFWFEGYMPEKTQATVSEFNGDLPEEIKDDAIMAYDITLKLDGEEVQPEEGEAVTVSISNEMIGAAVDQGSQIVVWHVADNGSVTEVRNITVDGNTITFDAESFSVYVVGVIEDVYRLHVVFMSGDTQVADMYVKDGDDMEQVLYDPGVGSAEGSKFKGWTQVEDYTATTTRQTIEDVRDEIADVLSEGGFADGETVTYYAMLFDSYYVRYIDERTVTIHTDELIKRVDSTASAINYTVEWSYTPINPELTNFEGWAEANPDNEFAFYSYPPETVYENGASQIEVSSDIVLRAYCPGGNWITFKEQGGTYTAPEFVKTGELSLGTYINGNTEKPDPTRYGYTFDGWYKDAACSSGQEFVFGETLDSNITIYAKWIVNPSANYSIIIWKQNVDGESWDFEESFTFNGPSGLTIDDVTSSGSGDDAYASVKGTAKQYTGFHLSGYDTNVQISPEGTSIVNVYYVRNQHTLTFVAGGGSHYEYVLSTSTEDDYYYKDSDGNGRTYMYYHDGKWYQNRSTEYEYYLTSATSDGNHYYPSGNGYNYGYLYYNDGTWYRNRNGFWPFYRYSNAVSGAYDRREVYAYSNEYTGERYERRLVSDNQITITALYGQSISSNFPITINGTVYNRGERWKPDDNSQYFKQVIVYIDTMPDEDVTFTLDDGSGKAYYDLRYYVEALSGDSVDKTYDGKNFTLHKNVRARINVSTDEDFLDLIGFTKLAPTSSYNYEYDTNTFTVSETYQESGHTVNVVNFYYTRDTYEIVFKDGIYVDGNGVEIKRNDTRILKESDPIAFNDDISSFGEDGEDYYEPKNGDPAGFTADGYVFDGWYIDTEGQSKYTFDKMPQGGMTLFAKWIHRQYRVFLHPNAEDDPTLRYGDADQGTSFRVDYSSQLSDGESIFAERDNYELVGWYTDPDFKHVFTFSTFILNDSTVKTVYVKTRTSETDKYGNALGSESADGYVLADDRDYEGLYGDKYIIQDGYVYEKSIDKETNEVSYSKLKWNKDGSRYWITYSLDLYAQWRSKLEGANGIYVVYDAGEGDASTVPVDSKMYTDKASVDAGAATTISDETKQFKYWVIQDWTGSENREYSNVPASEFIDTDKIVLPGETFKVDSNYAHRYVAEYASDGSIQTAVYTLRLKAVYGKIEEPTPTHIYWYKNDGTTGPIHRDNAVNTTPLAINEAVDIQAAPERTGYDFVGWAKITEPDGPDAYAPKDVEGTMLVYYNPENQKFYTEEGFTNEATQVAADEANGYEALVAVWKAHTYTVVFDKNAEDATGTMEDQEFEFDKAQNLYDNGFTRPNYTFLGWSEDSSAETATYGNQDSVKNLTAEDEAIVTLYAIWQLNEVEVRVEHYLLGTETKVAEDVTASVIIGEQYTAQPVTTYQEKNLTVNNYDPTQVVTVTQAGIVIKIYYTLPLTITSKTAGKTYDGTPLEGEFTVTGALASDEATINTAIGVAPSITHVSESTKTYEPAIAVIPGYYTITTGSGVLTINPAPLTVKTGSASKEYDGTALTTGGSIEGLVNDETVSFNVTGTITTVGSVQNSYTLAWTGTAKQTDYTLSEQIGTLTITKATMTITAVDYDSQYDGENHEGGYTGTLPEGTTVQYSIDGTTWTNVAPSITNVGTVTYTVRATNPNYEDATDEGTLTVSKRTVTLKANDANNEYTGSEITYATAADAVSPYYSISAGSLATGEAITAITLSGAGITAGTYPITIDQASVKIGKNGTDTTSNYTISVAPGTLTISANEVEITVVPADGSKVYDGTPLTKTEHDDFTVTGVPTGFTWIAEADGTVTNVTPGTGEKAVNAVTSFKIFNAANEDVTAQFANIDTSATATLTITARPVTITANSAEKYYDGTPLTAEAAGYTVSETTSESGIVSGQTIASIEYSGSITEVGTTTAAVSDAVIVDTATTANYDITYATGTLEIKKSTSVIVISSGTESWVYDGETHTYPVYTVKYGTGEAIAAVESNGSYVVTLPTNDKVTITSTAGIRDFGEKDNSFEYELENSGNYESVETSFGSISITKRQIKLWSEDGEKVYDGTPLTKPELHQEGEFVNGDAISAAVTGTITLVGETANTIEITSTAAVSANYEIITTEGTLKVTARAITITAISDTKVYDGHALTNDEIVTPVPNLAEGDTVASVTVTGSQTVVGSSANVPSAAVIKNAANEDVTSSYAISYANGTLEVTAKEVTITAISAEKVYDGQPLTANEITHSALADGDVVSTYKVTGSQTNVGSSANVPSDAIIITDADGQNVTDSYTIHYENGTLTVTTATAIVYITGNTDSKTYNGEEQSVTGYAVSISSAATYTESDFRFNGDATAKGTNVTTYAMGLEEGQFVNNNTNFDVTFVVTDGALTITPLAVTVTITGTSAALYYNGEVQQIEGYSVEISSPLYKEADFSFNGDKIATGSAVGEYEMGLTTAAFTNNNDNFDVTFVVNDGLLEIKPIDITVTIVGNTGTAIYDGKEHIVTGYAVTSIKYGDNETTLYSEDDFTFNGTAEAKGTDVNTYQMNLNANQFSNINDNFETVTFNVTDGWLEITRREVTITAADATKVYDGEALTTDGATVVGLAEGDTHEFTVAMTADSTITNVGTQANIIATVDGVAVSTTTATAVGNYMVTVVNGTLEITKLAVTVDITGHTDSKVYNGEEQKVEGYDVEISNDLYTKNDFSFSGEAIATGVAVNTYPMGLAVSQFTNNNNNFDVTFNVTDGALEITKLAVTVTITGNEATKPYNGKEQSVTGYALSDNSDLYDPDTMVQGPAKETVIAKGTNVGGYAAGLTTASFTNNNNNFEVTFELAKDTTLTITAISVTVTVVGNTNSAIYNGEAQTKTGYTATADSDLYDVTKDFTFSGTASAIRTHVVEGEDTDGKTDMGLTAEQFTNTNKNFESVTFAVTDGWQEITTRTVTITSDNGQKEYDGTALTVTTVAISGDGFVEGEGATYSFTGSQTEVGTTDNAFTYTLNEGTQASDYNISTEFGKLTVTGSTKALVISSADGSWTYDSAEHSQPVYTVTYGDETATADESGLVFKLSTGDTVTISNAATVKYVSDSGINNNTFDYVLTNADQYTSVTTTYGSLSITQAALTITADSNTKEYDGTALTDDGWQDTAPAGLQGSDAVASVDVTGSQIQVGSSDNVASNAVVKNGDTVVTANYNITYTTGSLIVTASSKEIVITSSDKSWTYDGEEHSEPVYTVTYGGEEVTADSTGYVFTLSTGDTVTITNAAVVKYVTDNAEGNNTFDYSITNAEQYTSKTAVYGTLTINKAPLTITADSNSKEYDGTALTDDGWQDTTPAGLQGNDQITSVTVTGSVIEVGTEDNIASDAVVMNGNTDVTTNYSITYNKGTLEITKSSKEIVISSGSMEWTYDGQTHTEPTYSVSYGTEAAVADASGKVFTLSTGDKVTITPASEASITHVAENTVTNTYSYVIDNAAQYENVTTEAGTLSITTAALTIKTGSAERAYNGEALTTGGSISGFVNNETATFEVTGTITTVGSVENTYSLVWDGTAKESDYSITEDLGTLKITSNTTELKIESSSKEWTYDAEEHTDHVYTVTYGGQNVAADESGLVFELSTGDKVTITPDTTAAITYVTQNTVANSYTYNIENRAQYSSVSAVYGELSITKAALIITADSNTKEYDGTALTDDGWQDTTPAGLQGSDAVASVDVTGSQIQVGSSDNVASNAVVKNGNLDVTANYNITYTTGSLIVTASSKEIVISSGSFEWKYDGTEHDYPVYSVTYGTESAVADERGKVFTLSTGDTVTITPTKTVKNVGDSGDNSYRYVLSNEEQYTSVSAVYGTLTITPRTITLTSATDSKEYDGTALTATEVAISGDGFVTGEGISFDVTGSQTEIGSTANAFSYELEQGTLAENYSITTAEGILTVTANSKAIVISSADGSWMYDGASHSEPTYTVTYDGTTVTAIDGPTNFRLPTGDWIHINGTRFVTNVSDSGANSFTYTLDNDNQYASVTTQEGILTITERTVIITSASDSKEYDGEPLTNDEITVTGDGFAANEGASYNVTGTITEVGTTENAFTYTLNEGTLAENYSITTVAGILTVSQSSIEVKISSDSESWMYDGKDHSLVKYTVTFGEATIEGAEGDTEFELSTGDKITISTPAAVKHVADSGNNSFSYVLENADQYATVTTSFGSLTITPRDVLLISADDEKDYDSKPLTNDEVTVSGTGFVDGEGASYEVTGSQTAVGSSQNVFTYTLNDGTTATDYEIDTTFGTLTVNGKEIIITAKDAGKTYDAKALTEGGFTVSGQAAEDLHVFEVVMTDDSTITNVGTQANIIASVDGVRINATTATTTVGNYIVTVVNGTLTVNAAPLTITAIDQNYTYNGSMQGEGDTVYDDPAEIVDKVSVEGLQGNDRLDSIVLDGTETNVGVYEGKIVPSNANIGPEEARPNDNYNIVYVAGTLTITKAAITITAASETKVYDGEALTTDAWIATETQGKDVVSEVTVTGSQILVGFSDNVASDAVILRGQEDVTSNYAIEYVNGTLTVTDENVPNEKVVNKTVATTVSADGTAGAQADAVAYKLGETITWTINVTNIYDETKTLTVEEMAGMEIVSPNPIPETLTSGETITITVQHVVTAADVAAGSIANTVTVTLGELTTTGGSTVETEPIEIVIIAASDSKVYDGEELTSDAYILSDDTPLAEGNTIAAVTVTGSQTLVGTSANIASDAKIVNAAGEDVTSGYAIEYVAGTLTVTDGSSPNEPDVPDDKVVTKTVNGEVESYKLGDTVTWTITVTNIYDETKTWAIEEAEGMTIEAKDGVELIENGTMATGRLTSGASIDITVSHVVTAEDVSAGSITNNVTATLGDLEKEGESTVTTEAIEITITADSDSKTYDGKELTATGYRITSGDLNDGDEISEITVTGSQILVGTSANVAKDAKIWNLATKEDVTAGYKITYVAGTLTVTDGTKPDEPDVDPEDVVSKTAIFNNEANGTTATTNAQVYKLGETVTWTVSVTNIYDEEKTLTVEELEGMTIVDGDKLPESLAAGANFSFTVEHVVTADDVVNKQITNTVTVTLGDKELTTTGSSTVDTTKTAITITAASDSKTYDGTALTNDGYELTAGELAAGNSIESVTVTGSQTLVGESPNKASEAKIVDADGNDVTKAYEITYVDGKLTVTDGTGNGEEPVPDDKVIVKTDENGEDSYKIGETVSWTIEVTNIYAVEKNFVVSELEGMTIEAQDGVEIIENGTMATGSLTSGASITLTVTHVVTTEDVSNGSITNKAKVELSGGDTHLDKEDDDTVTTAAIKITITADSASKTYDGTALTKDSWKLTEGELAEGHEIESVTVTGSQTPVGSSNNVPSEAKIVDADDNDVTKAYEITYVNGKLTVNARQDDDEEVEPAVEPTKPAIEPTEPAIEPTEPAIEPTEPAIEPTEPAIEPTEPAIEEPTEEEEDDNVVPFTPYTPNTGRTTPTEPAEEVEEEDDDNETPLTPFTPFTPDPPKEPDAPPKEPVLPDDTKSGGWAVLNLVLSIGTALSAAAAYIFKKKKEDEDEEATRAMTPEQKKEAEEAKEKEEKKKRNLRLAGVAVAVASAITFILTEDMTQVPVLLDKWTLLMAAYFGGDAYLTHKSRKEKDEDDKEEQAKA